MSSRTSSPWLRRSRRLVVATGALAALGALRSKAIERQAKQHPYILDQSLPVPCDERRPS
jgi:hypothetical protein